MSKDPIVVLGARVIDGRPSRMLAARLSTALSLWRSEPEREMIVSGFEEAGAMAAWLVARGVPQRAITLETAARSTNENLENSRALCPEAARLTVVTNSFHVLRTRVWAWHLGIPVEVIAAPTPARSRLKNYAREVVALPHSVARVIWRRVRTPSG
ncbi:YdcF family protein [Corynebacterium sanguinis]|uniref:YdcF family protein n=1 Tax=Corynebacterium sanguinis TaxID=2594913 RepID=A0A6C1U160_9CORY|nr:YdcF family protein [Corynebacterium sanguinis]TVS27336.1 YdcF family protein [Corynebacterium sanguinis]TVS30349.1 YdcF family protein [Corynebacterium sanguinis]